MSTQDDWLTLDEAAGHLRCSVITVRRYVQTDGLARTAWA